MLFGAMPTTPSTPEPSRLSSFLYGTGFVVMWSIILELVAQSYFHGDGNMTPFMWVYTFVATGISFTLCLKLRPLERLGWMMPTHWIFWPLAAALGFASGCGYAYAMRYYDLPPSPITPSLAYRSMALTGGPVLEELIFRWAILGGFLLLLKKIHLESPLANWPANFATAVLFGLWHSTDNALLFFDAFFCALLLGWLRLRSRSVAVAALAHGAANLAVMYVTPHWVR